VPDNEEPALSEVEGTYVLSSDQRLFSPARVSTDGGWIAQENKGRPVMAKLIEFYIPKDFRKRARQAASKKRGQVIEFASPPKKTA
jgi:hypothetical protein